MKLNPSMRDFATHTADAMKHIMGWGDYPKFRLNTLVFDYAMSQSNVAVLVFYYETSLPPTDRNKSMGRWLYHPDFRIVVRGGLDQYSDGLFYVCAFNAIWTAPCYAVKEFLNNPDYKRVNRGLLDFLQNHGERHSIANERLRLQQLMESEITLDDFKRLLNQHDTLGD